MRVGIWSFYAELAINDNMRTAASGGLGDDAFYGQNQLYFIGSKRNINFISLDQVEDLNILDAILVFDYPKPVRRNCKICKQVINKLDKFSKKKYLILHECEVIKPNNWILSNHFEWHKIFTWDDSYVDGKKYIKLNAAPRKIPKNLTFNRIPNKHSVMIASNKRSFHPKELYTERRRCIEWYEKEHEKFDLFGVGWDTYSFPTDNWFTRKLNRISSLNKSMAPNYKNWKGALDSKTNIRGQYKFHYAYENAHNISGYILEKIFDAFVAESVPIYLGASNVENHIPRDCFIDKREFLTYEELDNYLVSMSNETYLKYMSAIRDFIYSNKFDPYSVESYVHTILENLKR